MTAFRKTAFVAALAVAVLGTSLARAQTPVEPEKEAAPRVQLAILLDTSNSMDGLINQAKAQLWKIVNEFIPARRDGMRPRLQVALYEYGNDSLQSENGYVRRVLALTDDLDRVSEELFALKTNGGQEYCGAVIDKAAKELAWSKGARDYKAIFIAGNEPFTQGKVDYRKACKKAIERSIVVNTIFCGPRAEGISTMWKDGAARADGTFMNIDQQKAQVDIPAPQDDELNTLNKRLNDTYIPFGAAGRRAKMRQEAQDENAQGMGAGSNAQRIQTKGSKNYRAGKWDLVDALKDKSVKIEEVQEKDLPENMRKMNAQQRKDYVAKKDAERAALQKRIQLMSDERTKYVTAKRRELAESSGNTLQDAVTGAVRSQAAKRGFSFEKPAPKNRENKKEKNRSEEF